jgi:tRNA threonylcarbamoyladenosine biosynthesis protein TsaB
MSAETMLVIETSTPRASLLLAGPGGVRFDRGFSSDRSHNAALFGPLDELLGLPEAGSLRRVLVGSGPGSYSGTRVGIAAAQGVAIFQNCPAVAVPSVLAVEAADREAGCLVIGDARRGSFWSARVRGRRMAAGPAVIGAAELEAAVAAALAEGAAVYTFEEPERFPLPTEMLAGLAQQLPDAAGILAAWQRADEATRDDWSAAPPQPMYLKPPHITAAKRPWLVR